MRTSVGRSPWHIVEGADHRYRSLTVATIIHDTIAKRLEEYEMRQRLAAEMESSQEEKEKKRKKDKKQKKSAKNGNGNGDTSFASEFGMPAPGVSILSKLDMDQALSREEYGERLEEYQGRLNPPVARSPRHRPVLDPGLRGLGTPPARAVPSAASPRPSTRRSYQVIPIAKPTDEEYAHHHMWRFWRHLSRAGRVTIFDRSWYGRVLVERIEGFATEAEWMRGYSEINDFEEQLVEHGVVLMKFWMHITKEEQLKRFKAREKISYKRWKLTDEDWRQPREMGPV